MPKSISTQKSWKHRNRKIIVGKSKPEKANIAILISNKTHSKANSIARHTKKVFKDLTHQKNTTIPSLYVSDNSFKICKAIFKHKENPTNPLLRYRILTYLSQSLKNKANKQITKNLKNFEAAKLKMWTHAINRTQHPTIVGKVNST